MNNPTKAFIILCFVAFFVLLIAVEVGRTYGYMVGALVPAFILICVRIIFYGVGDHDEMGRKSKRMGNDEDE